MTDGWSEEVSVVSRQGGKRVQPAGGYQLYSWYFLRISGAALALLALVHLFVTHYLKLPFETTFEFVANRWAGPVGPFWRTFDWLLLSVALVHGPMLGVQLSVEDYVHRRGLRLLVLSILYSVVYVFLLLGTVTILSFAPQQASSAGAEFLWLGDLINWSLVAVAVVTYVGTVAVLLWLARAWRQGIVYRGGWAMVAWILHRATGLGVALFLLIHILDITLVNVGPAVYDRTVDFYRTPFLIPMEVALVGAVTYHALNGLRVTTLDISVGALRRQRELFFAALTLSVLLVLPSALLLVIGQ